MSTKNIIIISALAVVLVVFGVLVALYGFAEDPEMFDDETIQGDKAVGSEFIYTVDVDGDVVDVTVSIVGESGSYYLLDVTELVALLDDEDGLQAFIMIHKETGELRFGEEGDERTFDFEEEELTLLEWSVLGEEGAAWLIASCEDDGIPYILEFSFGDETITAELTEVNIVEPEEEFERSEALDEYYFFDFEGSMDGREGSGIVYYHVVADCGPLGWAFVEISEGTFIDDDGNEYEEVTVGYVVYDMTLLEFLTNVFTGGLPAVGTEEISTIDGDITCDTYTQVLGPFEINTWIGENGAVYKSGLATGEYTIILNEYSLPAE